MNLKRGIFGVLAAVTMMLSVAGAASAAPNSPNANCVAGEAVNFQDIASYTQWPNPTGGPGNYVAGAANTNCGSLG